MCAIPGLLLLFLVFVSSELYFAGRFFIAVLYCYIPCFHWLISKYSMQFCFGCLVGVEIFFICISCDRCWGCSYSAFGLGGGIFVLNFEFIAYTESLSRFLLWFFFYNNHAGMNDFVGIYVSYYTLSMRWYGCFRRMRLGVMIFMRKIAFQAYDRAVSYLCGLLCSLQSYAHIKFWSNRDTTGYLASVTYYFSHIYFWRILCRFLNNIRVTSCNDRKVFSFWFSKEFFCYLQFFCRKTVLNGIIMLFLFCVLLSYSPSFFLGSFCNHRKMIHRLIGFLFSFLIVAIWSSGELEEPSKDYVTEFLNINA